LGLLVSIINLSSRCGWFKFWELPWVGGFEHHLLVLKRWLFGQNDPWLTIMVAAWRRLEKMGVRVYISANHCSSTMEFDYLIIF
jgi:hypothetical protein